MQSDMYSLASSQGEEYGEREDVQVGACAFVRLQNESTRLECMPSNENTKGSWARGAGGHVWDDGLNAPGGCHLIPMPTQMCHCDLSLLVTCLFWQATRPAHQLM